MTAENILKFKELDVQENYSAKDLKNPVIKRIPHWSKKDLVSLLRFLDNPGSSKNELDGKLFHMPPKAAIINLAKKYLIGFFPLMTK